MDRNAASVLIQYVFVQRGTKRFTVKLTQDVPGKQGGPLGI